jgi:methionyl-tRNA synthetase
MIERYRDGLVPSAEISADIGSELSGLTETVRDYLDRAEITLALEEIWARGVRRLNRYVEEQAPWQLAKDDSRAGDLDRVLRSLAEGVRVVTVLLSRWLPTTAEKLLGALGAPDLALAGARFGAGDLQRVERLEPLFPKQQPTAA